MKLAASSRNFDISVILHIRTSPGFLTFSPARGQRGESLSQIRSKESYYNSDVRVDSYYSSESNSRLFRNVSVASSSATSCPLMYSLLSMCMSCIVA